MSVKRYRTVVDSKEYRDKRWIEKYERLVGHFVKGLPIPLREDGTQEAWLELLELENKEDAVNAVGRAVERVKDRSSSYSKHTTNPIMVDDEGNEIDFIEEVLEAYGAEEPTEHQKVWLRVAELFIRHALNHEERMTWWLKPKKLGFSPGMTYEEIAAFQSKHPKTVGLMIREVKRKIDKFNDTNRLPRKISSPASGGSISTIY